MSERATSVEIGHVRLYGGRLHHALAKPVSLSLMHAREGTTLCGESVNSEVDHFEAGVHTTCSRCRKAASHD